MPRKNNAPNGVREMEFDNPLASRPSVGQGHTSTATPTFEAELSTPHRAVLAVEIPDAAADTPPATPETSSARSAVDDSVNHEPRRRACSRCSRGSRGSGSGRLPEDEALRLARVTDLTPEEIQNIAQVFHYLWKLHELVSAENMQLSEALQGCLLAFRDSGAPRCEEELDVFLSRSPLLQKLSAPRDQMAVVVTGYDVKAEFLGPQDEANGGTCDTMQVHILCDHLGLEHLTNRKEEPPTLCVRRQQDTSSEKQYDGNANQFVTCEQLSRLPEFENNVFLSDLVALFSASGKAKKLSLYELIDLYSAFSRAASLDWKYWVAFSLFDTTRSCGLTQQDISRTLRKMTAGTKNTTMVDNQHFAARRIQQALRGYRARYNDGRHTKELVARCYCIRLLNQDIDENDGSSIDYQDKEQDDTYQLVKALQKRLKATPFSKLYLTLSELMRLTRRLRAADICTCTHCFALQQGRRKGGNGDGREQVVEGNGVQKLQSIVRGVATGKDVLPHLVDKADKILRGKQARLQSSYDAVASMILTKSIAMNGSKVLSYPDFRQAMDDNQDFKHNFCITCTDWRKLRSVVDRVDALVHNQTAVHTSNLQAIQNPSHRALQRKLQRFETATISNAQRMPETTVRDGLNWARPPSIHERLGWLDLDAVTQVAIGSLNRDGSATDSMLTHFAASAVVRSVRETIDDACMHPVRSFGSAVEQLQQSYDYLSSYIFLWFLSNVEHKHGHGVAEVMELAKFLLFVNVKIGCIWLILVMLPREYVKYTYSSGSEVISGLFYDSFNRTMTLGDGWIKNTFDINALHMDALYLSALVLAMIVSFLRLLALAGKTNSAGALEASLSLLMPSTETPDDDHHQTLGDDGARWHSILGDFDFTKTYRKSSIKMRQGIRRRIDDWEFDRRESAVARRRSAHNWWSRKLAWLRAYRGTLLFSLLVCFYAFCLQRVYAKSEALEQIWGQLPAVLINILLLACEEVMSMLTRAETMSSAQRQKAFVHRTFYLKVFTMLSMFANQVKIMSVDYVDFVPNTTIASQTLITVADEIAEQTIGRIDVDIDVNASRLVEMSESETTGSDGMASTCAEAHVGAFYLNQLATLCVQTVLIQAAYVVLHRYGFPKFWKLWKLYTIVNHYSEKQEQTGDVSTGWIPVGGIRLQHRNVSTTKAHYEGLLHMAEENSTHKVDQWWKVAAPKSGPGHQHAVTNFWMKKFCVFQIKRRLRHDAMNDQAYNGDTAWPIDAKLQRWLDELHCPEDSTTETPMWHQKSLGDLRAEVSKRVYRFETVVSALDPASFMLDMLKHRIILEVRVLLSKFISRENLYALCPRNAETATTVTFEIRKREARSLEELQKSTKEDLTSTDTLHDSLQAIFADLDGLRGLDNTFETLQNGAMEVAGWLRDDATRNEDYFSPTSLAQTLPDLDSEHQAKLLELHALANLFDRLPVFNLQDLTKDLRSKSFNSILHDNVPSRRESRLLHEALYTYEQTKRSFDGSGVSTTIDDERSKQQGSTLLTSDVDTPSQLGKIGITVLGESSWRALVYVAELKRYMDLLRARKCILDVQMAAIDAAEKISRAAAGHESLQQSRLRVHKSNRSWRCCTGRSNDPVYNVLDHFANHCFECTESETTVSDAMALDTTTAEAQDAISTLRKHTTSLPDDFVLLLADGMREVFEVIYGHPRQRGRNCCGGSSSRWLNAEFDMDAEEQLCVNLRKMFLEPVVDMGGLNALTQSVFHISYGSKVNESLTKKWYQVIRSNWNSKNGTHVWTRYLATKADEWITTLVEEHQGHENNGFSEEDVDEVKLRLANMKVTTIGEVIKKDAIGTLMKTWRHKDQRQRAKKLLSYLRQHQGRLVDVTQQVTDYRHWYLPKRPLEGQQISKLVTNMLYRQALVWAGMPFCPWLPCVSVVLEFAIFISIYTAMMSGTYATPNEKWSAGETTSAFLGNYMLTLFFCAVSITMWLNVEPSCGAHEGIRVFDTMGELYTSQTEQEEWLNEFDFTTSRGVTAMAMAGGAFSVRYILNPPFLLLVLCMMLASRKLKTEMVLGVKAEGERMALYHRAENKRLHEQLERYVSEADIALQTRVRQQARHTAIASVLKSDAQNAMNVGSMRSSMIVKERRKTFASVITRVWATDKNTRESPGNMLWAVHNIAAGTRPMLYFNQQAVQLSENANVRQQEDSASDGGLCNKHTTERYLYEWASSRSDAPGSANGACSDGIRDVELVVTAKRGAQCRGTQYDYQLTLQGTRLLEVFANTSTDSSARLQQSVTNRTDGGVRYNYRVRVTDWKEKFAQVDQETETPLTDRMVMEYKVVLEASEQPSEEANRSVHFQPVQQWSRWCRYSDIVTLQHTFGTCLRPNSKECHYIDGFKLPESYDHETFFHLHFKRRHKGVSAAGIRRTAENIQHYLSGFLSSSHCELHALQNPYFLAICGALGSLEDWASVDPLEPSDAGVGSHMKEWKLEECVEFLFGEDLSVMTTQRLVRLQSVLYEATDADDTGDSLEIEELSNMMREQVKEVFDEEGIDGQELVVMTRKRLQRLLNKASAATADDLCNTLALRRGVRTLEEEPSNGEELGASFLRKAAPQVGLSDADWDRFREARDSVI